MCELIKKEGLQLNFNLKTRFYPNVVKISRSPQNQTNNKLAPLPVLFDDASALPSKQRGIPLRINLSKKIFLPSKLFSRDDGVVVGERLPVDGGFDFG